MKRVHFVSIKHQAQLVSCFPCKMSHSSFAISSYKDYNILQARSSRVLFYSLTHRVIFIGAFAFAHVNSKGAFLLETWETLLIRWVNLLPRVKMCTKKLHKCYWTLKKQIQVHLARSIIHFIFAAFAITSPIKQLIMKRGRVRMMQHARFTCLTMSGGGSNESITCGKHKHALQSVQSQLLLLLWLVPVNCFRCSCNCICSLVSLCWFVQQSASFHLTSDRETSACTRRTFSSPFQWCQREERE